MRGLIVLLVVDDDQARRTERPVQIDKERARLLLDKREPSGPHIVRELRYLEDRVTLFCRAEVCGAAVIRQKVTAVDAWGMQAGTLCPWCVKALEAIGGA